MARAALSLGALQVTILKHSKILRRPVRVGFVGLTDCAPLVVAQEHGLFAQRGVHVELSREVGWATIRDKIVYGQLEAAHAPAGLLFAATAGLNTVPADCLTAMVLNLHGNAIVLSQRVAKTGATDGHKLREHIRRKRERLTFGVVYHWSSHHVLLRQWLRDHGIDPDRDVQVVIVPPSQVFANLRAGHLDGYCVGEPWASLAVANKAGFVVARSAELAPLHPEKVLMARADFAERAQHDHLAVVAALLEACAWCDAPENREELVRLLARPEYVNAPAEALRMSMCGRYDFGLGREEECPGFNLFSREDANAPAADKAAWVIDGLVRTGLATREQLPADLAARCFRADLHEQALALLSQTQTHAA
jgi:ABC-type nitrate/sulfonate/bicarbonate transport system substrate-binding protein